MEGLISEAGKKRLPVSIQKMDTVHQHVFIHLRLRRREEDIIRLTGIPREELKSKVKRIKEELVREGKSDLVEDPSFLSIHLDQETDRQLALVSPERSVEDWIVLKELASILQSTLHQLPRQHYRILTLKYIHEMTPEEILVFCKKNREPLLSGKDILEGNVKDINKEINTALKALLVNLKLRLRDEGENIGIGELKTILKEFREVLDEVEET